MLYKSTDGGTVWNEIDGYYADGGVITTDPENSDVFWTGGSTPYMAISKTTNQGTTWARYVLTSDSGYAHAIAIEPGNSNTVYAGGQGGLFRTTNAGASWSNVSSGINGTVSAIAIDPAVTNVLYAGTESGVFKSTDAGASWSNTGCTNVNALLIIPAYPDSLLAGTDSGVFLSADGGASWTPINEGLTELEATGLGSDPDDHLFASTMGAGMFRRDIESAVEEVKDYRCTTISSIQPNPARIRALIEYNLARRSRVKIAIYDCAGRLVCTLFDNEQCAGQHSFIWNLKSSAGLDIPAGIYFCRLNADAIDDCCKLTIIR